MSELVTVSKKLTPEFLSYILITAFDGSYGGAWYWSEPATDDWLQVECKGEPHPDGDLCIDDLWMAVKIRVSEESLTGYNIFDDRDGYWIDHEKVAAAIQRIIDDNYLKAKEGETARAYRADLAGIITADLDDADIDADFADAIVQVAAFGKCIFG